MKILIAIIAVLAMAGIVGASPWLVSDPQTGVTRYDITGWTPTSIVAQADGSLRMDVGGAVAGTTYNMTLAACNVWGCSVTVPFVLQKTLPSAPSQLRLVP